MKPSHSLLFTVAFTLAALIAALTLSGCQAMNAAFGGAGGNTYGVVAGTSYPYSGMHPAMTVNGLNMLAPLNR